MEKAEKQAIVLVHGLWMWRWTWWFYKRFFKAEGFNVYVFGYSTTGQPIEKSMQQLSEFINNKNEQTVHLVVHSMGGILSMRALPQINKAGKLVMLGSPVNGSQVSKKIKQRKWHKLLLRHATEPLVNGVQNPSIFRHSKMIAGNLPVGIGQTIHRMQGPSDGTVSVDETQADWIDEHIVIHANHLGLLKNKVAKKLALDFLQKTNTPEQTNE